MQPCTIIYYFVVLLIAQHVSSDKPLIIRSSKTVIAASGFTYVCGCRPLSRLSGNCKADFVVEHVNGRNLLSEVVVQSG